MQKAPYDIDIFLAVVSGLIIFMLAFIVSIIYLYRKKQQSFEHNMEQLKLDHEKTMLNAQLEIQEQTFQHISWEIHDNISLSLTLVKLQLNTFDWDNKDNSLLKIDSSIELLSKSIVDLSDISKSLNADIIIQHGLLKAIEDELKRINAAAPFNVKYNCIGVPVFMEPHQELIIFRIIQEAFNNIIKHARARSAHLDLHYYEAAIKIDICDDGIGFEPAPDSEISKAGIHNMQSRTKTLGGQFLLESIPGKGTSITFTIPFTTHE